MAENAKRICESLHNYGFITGDKPVNDTLFTCSNARKRKQLHVKKRRKIRAVEVQSSAGKTSVTVPTMPSCDSSSDEESTDSDGDDLFGLATINKKFSYQVVSPQYQEGTTEVNTNEKAESCDDLDATKPHWLIQGATAYAEAYKERIENENDLGWPEQRRATWSQKGNKFLATRSTLSNYKCWKCTKVGHLPEDCTVNDNRNYPRSPILQELYKRSAKLKKLTPSVKCSHCQITFNLACCMDCELILCDTQGHLASHLDEYPSHRTIFSFKLQKILKCAQPECQEINIRNLKKCNLCLDKAFERHYSMITASWKRSGLSCVLNALRCKDHLLWHYTNCINTTIDKLYSPKAGQQISEFFF